MQCVILAAGKGVRMRPFTDNTPKPLLSVFGHPLLEHIMAAVPREITEFIIVVGYLGEQIQAHFGNEFRGCPIRYVVQEEQLGTYRALELTRPYLRGDRFLVLYADDLHSPISFTRLLERNTLAMLVSHIDDPRRFGVVLLNSDGSVREIEERPEHPKSNLANCGGTVLDRRIFDFPPPRKANGEYYLAESMSLLAQAHKIYAVTADWWVPIGFPEDLKKAEFFLRSRHGVSSS